MCCCASRTNNINPLIFDNVFYPLSYQRFMAYMGAPLEGISRNINIIQKLKGMKIKKKKSARAGNQALRAKFLQSKQEEDRSGACLSCNQKLLETAPWKPSSSVSVSRALLEKHWSLEMHRLTFLRGWACTHAHNEATHKTRHISAWRGNLSYSCA